jgi:uncharacterized membrane protein
MAESRHRHKHAHHHTTPVNQTPHEQRSSARKAGVILAVFIGLLGLAVAFFAVGTTNAVIIGGVVGIVLGFLIGSSLDRAAEKRKL